MICNKCGKEIDDDLKTCSNCENKTKDKKIVNKRVIILGLISILVIVTLVVFFVMSSNNKKEDDEDTLYSLSELEFLKDVDTNKLFVTLEDDEVNSELKDTFAIVTGKDISGYYVAALRLDNEMIVLANVEDDSSTEVRNLFYSNGKVYYNDTDWNVFSIDLNEGNGNYNLIKLNVQVPYNQWFYVIDNKFYSLSEDNAALLIRDLTTGELEVQYFNIRQGYDLKIDNKEVNVNFNNVYIEDDKYIYILSEDKKNIYKIDINNPTIDDAVTLISYTKVDKIGKNAHSVSGRKKFKIDGIRFLYKNGDLPELCIMYNDKMYNLKSNHYLPITLLPNNYLLVEEYNDESILGEAKYINLKTGLVDEDYSLGFTDYYGYEIYFIVK